MRSRGEVDDRVHPVGRDAQLLDGELDVAPAEQVDVHQQGVKLIEGDSLAVTRRQWPGCLVGPEYALTEAGQELATLVSALGTWGQRWLARAPAKEDLDLEPLLVDMQRRVRFTALPKEPFVVRFEVRGHHLRFMLLKKSEASLCHQNPGFPEPICVRGPLAALVAWWRGDMSFVGPRPERPEFIADLSRHILLHEAAHLRRRDDWASLLELVVAGLFWVNPLVHTARRGLGLGGGHRLLRGRRREGPRLAQGRRRQAHVVDREVLSAGGAGGIEGYDERRERRSFVVRGRHGRRGL